MDINKEKIKRKNININIYVNMNREIKQKQKSNLWRPSCFLHMGNHRPCTGCSDVPKTCQKNSDVPKTCQNFCQKPVKIFIFALFFSKYSFSSLNMYSFWPQDKRNKEDDVGDEDEDVPEGQPSPHRLGPETESLKQKVWNRKFKTESLKQKANWAIAMRQKSQSTVCSDAILSVL